MSNAYTASTVIAAAPDAVFDYVRRPENQPQWAVNFVRATAPLGDGRWTMETPFGQLVYRVETDDARRVVDFVLETPAGESVLPTRVIPHARGSVFTFTITRAPQASDADWEGGKRGLDEELARLKELLEA